MPDYLLQLLRRLAGAAQKNVGRAVHGGNASGEGNGNGMDSGLSGGYGIVTPSAQ